MLSKQIASLTRILAENPGLKNSYATLLSSLRFNTASSQAKSFLVTSTQPDEGKTLVSVGLALTGLSAGERVLLIDGDFRRPTFSRAVGLEGAKGFADLLFAGAAPSEVVHTIPIPNGVSGGRDLMIVPRGREVPDILPEMKKADMRSTIRDLASGFDIVLVDSPPVLAVNDAQLLAATVEGILFVVGAGMVDRREVQLAKGRLEETGTPIAGVVLNWFDDKRHGPSTHPYHDYYLKQN